MHLRSGNRSVYRNFNNRSESESSGSDSDTDQVPASSWVTVRRHSRSSQVSPPRQIMQRPAVPVPMAMNPAQMQQMQPGQMPYMNMPMPPQFCMPQWQYPMPMMMPQAYAMPPMYAPMPYSQAVGQTPVGMPMQVWPQIMAGSGGYATPQPATPVREDPPVSSAVSASTVSALPAVSLPPVTSLVRTPMPLLQPIGASAPPVPPRINIPVTSLITTLNTQVLSQSPVVPSRPGRVDETVTEQVQRNEVGCTPEYAPYRQPAAGGYVDNTINYMYHQICGGPMPYSMMMPPQDAEGAVGGAPPPMPTIPAQLPMSQPQSPLRQSAPANAYDTTRVHSVHSTPITSANGGRPVLGRSGNSCTEPNLNPPITCSISHGAVSTAVNTQSQGGQPMNTSAGNVYMPYWNPACMQMPPPVASSQPQYAEDGSLLSKHKSSRTRIPHAIWPKFDGQRKWETFFKKWEAVAKQQCIAPEDKVGCLIMCIKKDAEDYMGTFSESVLSDFDKLTKAFEKGYGVTDNYRELNDKLTAAKQGKMSVNEFAIYVSSLANRLGLNSDEATERLAGEAFLRGINNQKYVGLVKFAYGRMYPQGIPLEIALAEYKRAVGDDATEGTTPEISVKAVTSENAGNRSGRDGSAGRQNSRNDSRSRGRDRFGNRNHSRSPTPNRKNDHMAFRDLRKDIDQLSEKVAMFMSTSQKDAKRQNSPGRKGYKSNECFKCGEVGHYAHECKNGETKPNTCLACKKHGHKTENCPSLATVRQIKALYATLDLDDLEAGETGKAESQQSENS